jgi:HK97 gp10 family phage protein
MQNLDISILNKIYENYLNKVGTNIVKDAQLNCPIRTGDLRNSIDFKVDNPKGSGAPELTISAGSKDVNYAIYVELGTRKQQAQPYLKPAARNKKNYKIT